MPKYRMNRNYTLRSRYGRSVYFEKGKETYIPDFMVKEATAVGAENCDKTAEPVATKAKVWTFEERKNAVYEVFANLIEKNDAKDFTASGQPSLTAVKKLIEFDLERAELDDFWKAYKVGTLLEE